MRPPRLSDATVTLDGVPAHRLGGRILPATTSSRAASVGGCELRLREDSIAELSDWTLAGRRGMGYATRAVRLVSWHAFRDMRIARIELYIEPDNAASLAVARAAGFTAESTFDNAPCCSGGATTSRSCRASPRTYLPVNESLRARKTRP